MAMFRTLAVTVAFLVAAGVGLPSVAFAQTSEQGQALGILFLLGASKTSTPANVKAPGQKPKPAADVKLTPSTAKDRTQLVRLGGRTVEPTDSSTGKHN